MGIPPNIRLIISLVITCATAVFGVLKVQPEFQGVAWIAAVGSVLAILAAIFTDSPQVTAQKATAKSRGQTMIAIDPPKPPPAEASKPL
jgi:uncharacterized membrane protein